MSYARALCHRISWNVSRCGMRCMCEAMHGAGHATACHVRNLRSTNHQSRAPRRNATHDRWLLACRSALQFSSHPPSTPGTFSFCCRASLGRQPKKSLIFTIDRCLSTIHGYALCARPTTSSQAGDCRLRRMTVLARLDMCSPQGSPTVKTISIAEEST